MRTRLPRALGATLLLVALLAALPAAAQEPEKRRGFSVKVTEPVDQDVVFGKTQLSYSDLDRRANQLAHHLRSLGAGPESRVGIFIERSPEMDGVSLFDAAFSRTP